MTYRLSPSAELPLREAYPFASAHGLAAQAQQIRDVAPPGWVHESVFRRALMVDLLRSHGLLERFIQECWPNGGTNQGHARLTRYVEVSRRAAGGFSAIPSGPSPEEDTLKPGEISASNIEQGTEHPIDIVVFVRGMAIFGTRRVLKRRQEQLLRRGLPPTVAFLGAFDKSGNYALASRISLEEIAEAIARALRHDQRLRSLSRSHVIALPASTVRAGSEMLVHSISSLYGDAFDQATFGVCVDGRLWRAGLTFLPEALSVTAFVWPDETNPRVRVLDGSGHVLQFLKREEGEGEGRITFGDPTSAVDAALAAHLGREISTTSRSGRTVSGVLRPHR